MSARDDRLLRLAHSLDNARGEAERLRLVASRAFEALGSPETDDADERSRLVEEAIAAEGPALAAEGLVRRLERAVSQLRLEGA